jgi:CTP synthase
MTAEARRKIALFCNVAPDAVIQSIDVPSIYEVPIKMHEQHLDEIVLRKTGITPEGEPHMAPWLHFLDKLHAATKPVTIGLVGKYVELQDAYKSINESLFQAATYNDRKLDLRYIHSEKLNDDNADELLSPLDGVIIAPGFGQRGIEGKFSALKWAREHDIPTLGICLGMQCMVIEFARDVLGMADANSTEMNPSTTHNVIDLMEEQKSISNMGGTMRLGSYECKLRPDSLARHSSVSVTATASNSTTTTARYSRRPEWHAWGRTPTQGW